MKSIQNQYRDLKEGRMSQANFMRNLRMTMPHYVTNVTSFNDAVKILKNKAILTEAALGENNLLDELESEMESGNSYAEAIAKVAANHNMNEDDLATKYPEEAVGNKAYADNYVGPVDDEDEDIAAMEEDLPGMAGGMHGSEDFRKAMGIEDDSPYEDEDIAAMVAKAEEEESGKYTKFQDFPGGISEAKKKKEPKAELHPNQIHPQELRMGIKVELEHTDDLDKAKKIALDHLAENPFYYTALKLSGIESPSVFTAKPPVKKGKKKETIQLVDLANQMEKVKMPKAEEKKKLKEANYNIDGEPNSAAEQAMKFVGGNATLKALSNDIEIQQAGDDAVLRFRYWNALPGEAIEKLKLQFDVEVMSDFDEDTGEIIAYRLTPLRKSSGSKDLGASFEKFKSQLEEVVRETLAEMQSDEQETDNMAMAIDEYFFDGRDNLADEIAAQQK